MLTTIMTNKPGFLVLYPTDTIYGLGVDATDPEAISHLRELKGREDKKPISIMVSDMEMMELYAVVTPLAKTLAEKFLPGKLTLVLDAKNLPEELTSGTKTIGVRMPKHLLCVQLVNQLGKPITATSANVSGKPTGKNPEEILKQFGDKADWITKVYDLGELPESAPSTVVDARGKVPIVIREGAIPREDIEGV